MARADGGNQYKRLASLEVRGTARLEAFDVFLPLLFPAWGESFELTVIGPPPGPVRTLRVPAHTDVQRAALVADEAARMKSGEPLWEMTRLDGQTAYLRMPTWSVYNSKWEWKPWLEARLDELVAAQTPALIIDLRGNEGGLDCGDPLVARLIEKDLIVPGRVRYVSSQATPDDLDPFLDTWDDSFRDWGQDATPDSAPALLAGNGRSFFRLAEEPPGQQVKTIAAKGERYRGRVVVLIDSVCSSATFQFARMIQQAGLATLVGEPTGGNQRGINGGAFFFLRLPNSKIEVDVPLIAYIMPGAEPPDAGMTPDVLVAVTPEDLRAGRDRQLEEAHRIARGSASGSRR